jgi:hypothetical protein
MQPPNNDRDAARTLDQHLIWQQLRPHAQDSRLAGAVVLQHVKLARTRNNDARDLYPHHRDCAHRDLRKKNRRSIAVAGGETLTGARMETSKNYIFFLDLIRPRIQTIATMTQVQNINVLASAPTHITSIPRMPSESDTEFTGEIPG